MTWGGRTHEHRHRGITLVGCTCDEPTTTPAWMLRALDGSALDQETMERIRDSVERGERMRHETSDRSGWLPEAHVVRRRGIAGRVLRWLFG